MVFFLNQGNTFIVLKSNIISNWAGTMYSSGYKKMINNISYVEDGDQFNDDFGFQCCFFYFSGGRKLILLILVVILANQMVVEY